MNPGREAFIQEMSKSVLQGFGVGPQGSAVGCCI